uniref:REP-associated tyrosine transposase n=1 Tax=Andreprevotia chitinilytica TaxID=396808 RepID=UPI001B809E5A|nr:transposase [Andreprevotia chitinilytica]
MTHERSQFFADWQVGRIVVRELASAPAKTLAFVVMPDHWHWLLELNTVALSALVQRVKSRSAVTVNRALYRQGQLWQSGFHDRALRYDEDVLGIARYVIANPLRAGLVKKVGDYPLWDAAWL